MVDCVYCNKPIGNGEAAWFRGSYAIHKDCDIKLSEELDQWEASMEGCQDETVNYL